MYAYEITMEAYEDIAKEVLNKASFIIWKLKLRALLSILPNKIYNNAVRNNLSSTFQKDFNEPYRKVIIELGEDLTKLEESKKILEDFLFQDYKTYLKENQDIHNLVNNAVLSKLNRIAHKFKDKIKEKALKSTIGEVGLIGFMNRIGIGVTTEITPFIYGGKDVI